MLPAKFPNQRPSGIGGEDFFKDFLQYTGVVAILVM